MVKKIVIGTAVFILVLAAFAPDRAGAVLGFLGDVGGNIVEFIQGG